MKDAEDKRVWRGPFTQELTEVSGYAFIYIDKDHQAIPPAVVLALLNDSHTPSKTEAALVEACRVLTKTHGGNIFNIAFDDRLKGSHRGLAILEATTIARTALNLIEERQGQVPEKHKDVYEKGSRKEASDVHGRNHAETSTTARK